MENIGIGELRSNPIADQCLKCFALYIKSIITLILNGYFRSTKNTAKEMILYFLKKTLVSTTFFEIIDTIIK